MADLGNFFVTIGSKLDSKGFENARKHINDIAKVGAAMGVALAAAGLKAAQVAGVQEQAELTLAQAMAQAGTFTQRAYEHNLEYARSLQKMTTYGDEAILGVQKMLTNFGVEGRALDDLTKATLDLAAAKGMDLKAAADLVAKSVGSSTNALSRYGIVIEGGVGSTERMQMAVNNITALFGGAASAQAQTYAGQIQQMQNRWGDFVERIGENVIPVMIELFDIVNNNILPIFEDWIDNVNESGTGVKWLATLIQTLIKIIVGVKAAFDIAGKAAATFALALSGNIKAAKLGWAELKQTVTDYGDLLSKTSELEVKATKEAQDRKKRIVREFTRNVQAEQQAQVVAEQEANVAKEEALIEHIEAVNEIKAEDAIVQAELKEQDDKNFLTSLQNKLDKTQTFVGTLSDMFGSFYDLQAQKIKNNLTDDLEAEDQRYEGRKAWINANVKDEQRRNKMLDELEQGHAATQTNLRSKAESEERKLKQKMKSFQIAEAIINTAVAATKALATGGPIIGPVLAAMITAMGIAQVAIIKAQKFAKGALIKQPTLATFAEEGPEVALPLKHPNTIEALSKALDSAGAGMSISITVPPITSRQVAREYGEVIGDEIMKKVKRNRKL